MASWRYGKFIDRILSADQPQRDKRLRQAIGVVVRLIMERRDGMPYRSVRDRCELIDSAIAW